MEVTEGGESCSKSLSTFSTDGKLPLIEYRCYRQAMIALIHLLLVGSYRLSECKFRVEKEAASGTIYQSPDVLPWIHK